MRELLIGAILIDLLIHYQGDKGAKGVYEYAVQMYLYYADNNKDAFREAYVNWFQLPQELDFDISSLWSQLDTLPGSMNI